MVILLLPFLGFIIAQNTKIHDFISNVIVNEIEKKITTKIYFKSINTRLLKRVSITNLYIEDQNGDTLLYSEKINLIIKNLDYNNKNLIIKKINLNNACINFKTDSTNTMNFQFIIDALQKKDTTKSQWKFSINNIEIVKSNFSYKRYLAENKPERINFSDILLNNFDIRIKNFKILNDTIDFQLSKLNLNEKSGFNLNKLNAQVQLCKQFFHLSEVNFTTDSTEIVADWINFDFTDFKDLKNFVNKVQINLSIQPSTISLFDLGYIVPHLTSLNNSIEITGNIYGKINSLKGKNTSICYNKNSHIRLNFDINGLPEINQTFLYLDISELTIFPEDIDNLNITLKDGTKFMLPENLKKFGNVSYNGNFTGFYDDFVAYGDLSTDIGYFSTDLSLVPETGKHIKINGKIKSFDLNLGELINLKEYVGKTNFNLSVNGYAGPKGKIKADIDGYIDYIEVNKYQYKSISLKGELLNKNYNGTIKIDDPNLKFQFSGDVNLSDSIPVFNFTAYAPYIKLYPLNIDTKTPDSEISFVLQANLNGNKLDNLDGELKILNSSIKRNGKDLKIENLIISAFNELNNKKLILRSDFIDARITGQYQFSDIVSSFKSYIFQYFPSIYGDSCDFTLYSDTINDFNYEIFLKNLTPVTNMFYPKLYIAENSFLKGKYLPKNHIFINQGYIDEILLGNNKITGLTINSGLNGEQAEFTFETKSFDYARKIKLSNFTLKSYGFKDSIFANFYWNREDTSINRGNIKSIISFNKGEYCKPKTHINIKPSEIIIYNSVWTIETSRIDIDTTSIKFTDDFLIYHEDQSMAIIGCISEKKTDSLIITLRDLGIGRFNNLLNIKNIKFEGYADGILKINDIFNDPLIFSDIEIEEFNINDQNLGNFTLNSNWNNIEKLLLVNAVSQKGKIDNLMIDGYYSPIGKKISFNIELDNIKTNMLSPVLSSVFSDIRGVASGKLLLKGTTQKPSISGDLDLKKTSFTVDYLQTRYNFTHKIIFENNDLILKDIQMFDTKGNSAKVNGKITNKYFKDWNLDLTIDAENLYCLNTTENDNITFFGQTYTSGNFKLSGPVNNITMDISAKTEPGTIVYIPLNTKADIIENDFITFTSNENTTKNLILQKDYEVNLSGIQLNMDLEVTPDAEIQMIFDPKIGDVIKSTGTGNIKMEINTLGKFQIFGDYIIEKGDYLFTLQNVINKKFNVKPGGQIIFSGDPYEANINIKAVYNLKVSLYELLRNQVDQVQAAEYQNNRYPVECVVLMTGKLSNPNIELDIELPDADENT
ncbi:MAG: translocation/assembly module TamB domain-containing protein, partial [Bacteroidales bacterium]|nr:translocation/assembly module TamB domain-containing protein [Bacteroidales bacterium]